MHDARHLRAVLRAHGQHVAPLAHGDDGVLQIARHGAGVQVAVELVADAIVCRADLAAHGGQAGACGVRDLLLGEDGGKDLLLQPAHGVQRARQAHKVRGFRLLRLVLFPDERAADGARGLHQPRAEQKVLGREDSPDLGPGDLRLHVVKGGDGLHARARHERRRLLGLRLHPFDLPDVADGDERGAARLAQARRRPLHKHVPNLIKFQDLE